ncbi:unnamed protein product [Sphacelaria rigidula]
MPLTEAGWLLPSRVSRNPPPLQAVDNVLSRKSGDRTKKENVGAVTTAEEFTKGSRRLSGEARFRPRAN